VPTVQQVTTFQAASIVTRALAFVMIGFAAGCAARLPVATAPASPRVDDLAEAIARGCFRCLEQAYDVAQARGARAHAFEAAALLVLRSKELGLPFQPWLERVRTLAAANPSSPLVLAILEAAPMDPLTDREASLNVGGRAKARAAVPGWRQDLQTASGSDAFRAYLELSLICGFQGAPERDTSVAARAWPQAPLVRYRIGTCSSSYGQTLTVLRAGDDAYVDADLALGRYALGDGTRPDQDEALRRFQSALSGFPNSPAIANTLGLLHQTREEWEQALMAFDAALAESPGNADASMGRTVSLSNLSRRKEAIDTATQMIDAGQWFVGEALYWRAWNELQLNQVAVARNDADRARTMVANAPMFVLSGMIDWRLRRLESAEEEFQKALTMDFGQCEAAHYMGIVRAERARLPEATAALMQARQCYDLSLTLRREAIDKILGGSASEAAKARETARQERAIKDIEGRRQEVLQGLQAVERAGASSQ
jgi:tetratricopeptide (TPR) repeat protein